MLHLNALLMKALTIAERRKKNIRRIDTMVFSIRADCSLSSCLKFDRARKKICEGFLFSLRLCSGRQKDKEEKA